MSVLACSLFFCLASSLMLTSLQNPVVKQMSKLHAAKERRKQGQFLLEGTHLLEEACHANYPLTVVCATPEWQAAHPELWDRACQLSDRAESVSLNVLTKIATTVHPDGVVASANRRQDAAISFSASGFWLVLETIQDPGNLGTMIRTAAAAGAEGLCVSADSVDLDHPKVLRASAGQWFRLPLAVCEDLPASVRQWQQQQVQVIATEGTAPMTYWDIDYRPPTAILLGNEGSGLSADLLKLADKSVRIPLNAGVESLNVAIAAATILYEVRRQRELS
ncbi:MAG: RNA methyltransferase [Cyanobacteria bacterium J007]|nr:MAG: RNA methyltransferase [Cyanobacteria bacterium J007]